MAIGDKTYVATTTYADQTQTDAEANSAVYAEQLTPVGSIHTFPTAAISVGFLECNGDLVSRTTYANLFAVIGEAYGVGDGSTTFGIPNFQGEFLRGWDNARGVDIGRGIGSGQTEENKSHSHANTAAFSGNIVADHTHVLDHDHNSFDTATTTALTGWFETRQDNGGSPVVTASDGICTRTVGTNTITVVGDGNQIGATRVTVDSNHNHSINVPGFTGPSGGDGGFTPAGSVAMTNASDGVESRPRNMAVMYCIKT